MSEPVTLLIFTDGRQECFERTYRSFWNMVEGNISHTLIIDDSANLLYGVWLDEQYGGGDYIVHHRARLGFGGAIRDGWAQLSPDTKWVFHLEDDFVFNRPIDLDALIEVLTHEKQLAQLAFKRQPWNEQEKAAGGVIEMYPQDYTEREYNGFHFLEHSRNFTTNPCLYSMDVVRVGWPETDQSEGRFGFKLRDLGYRFAYVGKRSDPPAVEHIGWQRVGTGY